MIYDALHNADRRDDVIEYIKQKGYKKVVDVGGAMNPWAREVVTHYIDLIDPHVYLPEKGPELYDDHVKNAEIIMGDIEDIDFLRKTREKYGMFDFIICSHVLEHLGNPEIFLKHLPHMGWRGFVSLPNKYVELTRNVHCGEDGREQFGMEKVIRGFAPHRWIFTLRESPWVLFCWPKLTILEQMSELDWVEEGFKMVGSDELSFFWTSRIPYYIIKDSELDFPSPGPAIDLYRKGLEIGI